LTIVSAALVQTVMITTTVDPDIEAFHRRIAEARKESVKKAIRFLIVFLLAASAGLGSALLIGSWDHDRKVERAARYERGELVVVRRGESATSTTPSVALPIIVGSAVGFVVFAIGAALIMRDKTYLRGLQAMSR